MKYTQCYILNFPTGFVLFSEDKDLDSEFPGCK